MTPEEIRNARSSSVDVPWESADWLREIAAQLAELNERLQPGNFVANIYDCTFDAGNQAGGRKS